MSKKNFNEVLKEREAKNELHKEDKMTLDSTERIKVLSPGAGIQTFHQQPSGYRGFRSPDLHVCIFFPGADFLSVQPDTDFLQI